MNIGFTVNPFKKGPGNPVHRVLLQTAWFGLLVGTGQAIALMTMESNQDDPTLWVIAPLVFVLFVVVSILNLRFWWKYSETQTQDKETPKDARHREWREIIRAKDSMEAMMIQSFLDTHGIENVQPFERQQQMEGGVSLDGGSAYGIRIDVPVAQHQQAMQVLKEKRDSMV